MPVLTRAVGCSLSAPLAAAGRGAACWSGGQTPEGRMGRMPADRAHVDQNTRERERLRALVARLTDDDLRRPVTDRWTVADMLGHLAFWDAYALSLAEKLEA